MGQIYMQRFEYRGAIDRSALDDAWAIANEVKAETGNWGSVEKGIKQLHSWATAWGGYALIEVEDPKALDQFQLFLTNNYAHLVKITIDPLVDLDAA